MSAELDYLELPPYMKISNNVIYIHIADEPKPQRVKMQDVVDYFTKYSGSRGFQSSYRFLGQIGGDWRPIDQLAEDCLYIFQLLNIEKLRKLSRRAGLEPKF